MNRVNVAQHVPQFDEETMAKYEEIRGKAAKEWLKPASVSLARLDEVKASVYNIGLGDASHIKVQGPTRQTGPDVPLTPGTQRSAWGSNASIPELMRQYAGQTRSRPESAKQSRSARPSSGRKPRPQSAKELSPNDVGKIRLSIAVKGAHQTLQSRPPKPPVMPPGCVPEDTAARKYLTSGSSHVTGYNMAAAGHVVSRRPPHLSVTRRDLAEGREHDHHPSYRQPPVSPATSDSEPDLAHIINETADHQPARRDLFHMPRFLRHGGDTNGGVTMATAGKDAVVMPTAALQELEDDSGVIIQDDDEDLSDGADELIEALTAGSHRGSRPGSKRRPASAKTLRSRRPPSGSKPRCQSAKPGGPQAPPPGPMGPIRLQLPSAEPLEADETEMDTERLIRNLDQSSKDNSVGFTIKPHGFGFVNAEVKFEPLGRAPTPEPEPEIVEQPDPVSIPETETIRKRDHVVTFKFEHESPRPVTPQKTVKYTGKSNLKHVRSRVDTGVNFSSSGSAWRPSSSGNRRRSTEEPEQRKAGITMVTVAYDDEDVKKAEKKSKDIETLISQMNDKDSKVPDLFETKAVSTNVNKNHYAAIENVESKTITTKVLSLDGCEVTSKQTIPGEEIRKTRDYVVEESHKPPKKVYKPSVPKATVAKRPGSAVVAKQPEPVVTKVEVREVVAEEKTKDDVQEKVEPKPKVEVPVIPKPKPRNRPSLVKKPPAPAQKSEGRRNYSSYASSRPRSAPSKKKSTSTADREPIYIWTRTRTDVEIDTPATRECKNMHFRLLEAGLDIPVETLKRALLPPQETSTYIDQRQKNKMAPLPDPSDGLLSSPAVWLGAEYKRLKLAERALERANERLFLQKQREEKARLAKLKQQQLSDAGVCSDNEVKTTKKVVKKKRLKSANAKSRTG